MVLVVDEIGPRPWPSMNRFVYGFNRLEFVLQSGLFPLMDLVIQAVANLLRTRARESRQFGLTGDVNHSLPSGDRGTHFAIGITDKARRLAASGRAMAQQFFAA